MAGLNVQEESLYLPEDVVRKSPGFTVDVGKSARIHALTLTHTHTRNSMFLCVCLYVCVC